MTVTVYLAAALLCFDGTCHPALVGENTPQGTYHLVERRVADPLYKGSVLQFAEDSKLVYAIHRPWLGRPSENRLGRLASTDPKVRVITKGCVNVHDSVYEKILNNLPVVLRIEP